LLHWLCAQPSRAREKIPTPYGGGFSSPRSVNRWAWWLVVFGGGWRRLGIIPWNGADHVCGVEDRPGAGQGWAMWCLKPDERPRGVRCVSPKLASMAGLPPGVVTVVTGAAGRPAQRCGASGGGQIAFTGCIEGHEIVRAVGGRHEEADAELGGKSTNHRVDGTPILSWQSQGATASSPNRGQVAAPGPPVRRGRSTTMSSPRRSYRRGIRW